MCIDAWEGMGGVAWGGCVGLDGVGSVGGWQGSPRSITTSSALIDGTIYIYFFKWHSFFLNQLF